MHVEIKKISLWCYPIQSTTYKLLYVSLNRILNECYLIIHTHALLANIYPIYNPVVTCPPLRDPRNGRISGDDMTFGAIMKFECEQGLFYPYKRWHNSFIIGICFISTLYTVINFIIFLINLQKL